MEIKAIQAGVDRQTRAQDIKGTGYEDGIENRGESWCTSAGR